MLFAIVSIGRNDSVYFVAFYIQYGLRFAPKIVFLLVYYRNGNRFKFLVLP